MWNFMCLFALLLIFFIFSIVFRFVPFILHSTQRSTININMLYINLLMISLHYYYSHAFEYVVHNVHAILANAFLSFNFFSVFIHLSIAVCALCARHFFCSPYYYYCYCYIYSVLFCRIFCLCCLLHVFITQNVKLTSTWISKYFRSHQLHIHCCCLF